MRLPSSKVFQLVVPGRSPPCHLRPHSQSNPIISIARQQQKIYICFIKRLPSPPRGRGVPLSSGFLSARCFLCCLDEGRASCCHPNVGTVVRAGQLENKDCLLDHPCSINRRTLLGNHLRITLARCCPFVTLTQ